MINVVCRSCSPRDSAKIATIASAAQADTTATPVSVGRVQRRRSDGTTSGWYAGRATIADSARGVSANVRSIQEDAPPMAR